MLSMIDMRAMIREKNGTPPRRVVPVSPSVVRRACRVAVGLLLVAAGAAPPCFGAGEPWQADALAPPLAALKQQLSLVRGEGAHAGTWPRRIAYTHRFFNDGKSATAPEERVVVMESKPVRIIPHAVGVAEILWAICPRERLVAFNEFAADPRFSLIAEEVARSHRVFRSRETETVIGLRPDLVFTVYYSGAAFKERLARAGIPFVDLGYFGTLASVRKQILLVGDIIGEEANAAALLGRMDAALSALKRRMPARREKPRILFYNEGGYVTGRDTNFNSLCDMIGAVNAAAAEGVRSIRQIDLETLLSWDPDVVIVPAESGLQRRLTENPMLRHLAAVRKGNVLAVPDIYLNANSQFMILGAAVLADILDDADL